jgi:hypothetical protein
MVCRPHSNHGVPLKGHFLCLFVLATRKQVTYSFMLIWSANKNEARLLKASRRAFHHNGLPLLTQFLITPLYAAYRQADTLPAIVIPYPNLHIVVIAQNCSKINIFAAIFLVLHISGFVADTQKSSAFSSAKKIRPPARHLFRFIRDQQAGDQRPRLLSVRGGLFVSLQRGIVISPHTKVPGRRHHIAKAALNCRIHRRSI